MKQIYKTLEVGEVIKENDEYIACGQDDGDLEWKDIKNSLIGCKVTPYNFVRRQINVIEIPEIPAGFRPFTKKDYEENIKGEIFVLNDKGTEWKKASMNSNEVPYNNFNYIIKEKKEFSAENIKPGMRFRKPAKEETIHTIGYAQKSVKFHGSGVVSTEELNDIYEVLGILIKREF
jgi:hypothetical protein